MVGWQSLSKLQKLVEDRETWHAAVHGVRHNGAIEQQQPIRLFSFPRRDSYFAVKDI